MPYSLRTRVFYLIRHRDIELAEDFVRRCPEVNDIVELNNFFHRTLSQFEVNTLPAREALIDTPVFEDWARHFEQDVLPVLRNLRFPALTAKIVPPSYQSAYHDPRVVV
jgi:hypothetical protein